METVYDKLKRFKEAVLKDLNQIDERKIYKIVCKLSTWHYPSKRTPNMSLTKNEVALYEYMLNNEFNPSTVYKWKLACNTSKHVQEQLKSGQIGFKKALSQSKQFKQLSQVEAEFLYQVKLTIQKYIIR